jgi:hypothetical protein
MTVANSSSLVLLHSYVGSSLFQEFDGPMGRGSFALLNSGQVFLGDLDAFYCFQELFLLSSVKK